MATLLLRHARVGVPGGGEDSCQGDSSVPLSIESTSRKDWIDATICELVTVTGTLNTALRWYFSRWLVHWQVQRRGWRCLEVAAGT
jgi:hypothetical protein